MAAYKHNTNEAQRLKETNQQLKITQAIQIDELLRLYNQFSWRCCYSISLIRHHL